MTRIAAKMTNLLLPSLLLSLVVCLTGCNPGPSTAMGGQPYATVASTPHAQTLEEGEALENRMAREAEEKAKHEQEPANQVRSEQEKIERQIQDEQQKAEGNQ